MERCNWCLGSELEMKYHDLEWGHYENSDERYFEFLILESFQTGLSWKIVLNKRDFMRKAFFNFDVSKLSKVGDEEVLIWMENSNLIRSLGKLKALVSNANCFMALVDEYGSFDAYLRTYLPILPIDHAYTDALDIPSSDKISTMIAKDLKKRGFKYLGPVTIYAFLQATGVYNDHLLTCYYRS